MSGSAGLAVSAGRSWGPRPTLMGSEGGVCRVAAVSAAELDVAAVAGRQIEKDPGRQRRGQPENHRRRRNHRPFWQGAVGGGGVMMVDLAWQFSGG
jgi:hypothetical protein